jgi:phage-related protein
MNNDQLDLIIGTISGEQYALSEFRVKVMDFVIEAPEPKHTQIKRDGYNGFIDAGTTFGGRTMRGVFYFDGYDVYDYRLRRNLIYRIFDSAEPFYLTESHLPDRRWLVKVASKYEVEQRYKHGFFEVEFVSPSPYAESIGLPSDDFTFDGTWEFGMGIPFEDFSYEHTTRSFSIWNLGDVMVDTRNYVDYMAPLTIQYVGASNGLTITNRTTGDVWKYFGTSASGDVITLEGGRSRKNGVSIYGQTNRARMRLAPGENEFQITGASGEFRALFDFRFLYI